MRDLSFKALDGLSHASGGSAVKCNRAIAVHGRTRRKHRRHRHAEALPRSAPRQMRPIGYPFSS